METNQSTNEASPCIAERKGDNDGDTQRARGGGHTLVGLVARRHRGHHPPRRHHLLSLQGYYQTYVAFFIPPSPNDGGFKQKKSCLGCPLDIIEKFNYSLKDYTWSLF